jgi:CRISPR-associated protein Cas2
MRQVFLVAYDVADDKRRTKIFNKLKGYGEALQFSLFRCVLTATQRLNLRCEIWKIINHDEDRVLVVDLGPEEGRAQNVLEEWGKALHDPANHDGRIIL